MSYKMTALHMKKVKIGESEGLLQRSLSVLSPGIGTLVWMGKVCMGMQYFDL